MIQSSLFSNLWPQDTEGRTLSRCWRIVRILNPNIISNIVWSDIFWSGITRVTARLVSIKQTTWFLSQWSQQARLQISLAGVQACEPGRLAAFICDHNCEFLRFYLRSPGYNWPGSGWSQWLLIKSLRVESGGMDRESGPAPQCCWWHIRHF